MKHKLNLAVLLVFAALIVCGCGLINSSDNKKGANNKTSVNDQKSANAKPAVAVAANKDLIDQAADVMFGDEKTNVPECDAALAALETEVGDDTNSESTGDRIKREAVRQTVYKLVRDNITGDSTAQQKKEIGERCRQAAAQFGGEK